MPVGAFPNSRTREIDAKMNATAAAISRLRNHLVKIPYYDSDSENTTSIPLVDQDAVGSSGLTTTTAVLLGFIVALALAGNIALLASILSNSKLRSVLLNILFCNIALLNLVDTVVTVFTSLLFVSHPSWILGNIMCKLSAFTQNLMMMLMLMAITVMAIERALGLLYEGKEILTRSRVAILWSGLVVVAFCFTVPIFAPNIPVKPFEFRYLCNIDSQSPIGYTIAIIVVYFLCLNMQLCCFGIILNRKYRERSLPMRPQDYGEFIRQSRALHDYIHMCKIVLTLLIIYVLIQGPYIVLNFVLQISNSYEVNGNEEVFRVHDDVVISLTLLKFLHPLLMPICVFVCCGEMWAQFIRIVCCTKSGTARLGTGDADSIRGVVDGSNRRLGINVMTVLATPDGLHLKYPNGYEYASQNPPSINAQNNNHAVYAQDQVVPYTYTSVEKIDSRSAVDKGQGPGDSAKKRSKKKQISTAHQQKRWRH